MKVWERFVSLLNGIVLLALAIVFFLLLCGQESLIAAINLGNWWQLGLFLTSAILCILSFGMMARRREEPTIVHQTPFGEIRITYTAVESLVLRATKRIKGVKEARAVVSADPLRMDIAITITTLPDLAIPQLSEEIRLKVDEYLFETTGIKVHSIKVDVDKIAAEVKSRVE
jgi:uncharacterized alkaline shock family protein YloU